MKQCLIYDNNGNIIISSGSLNEENLKSIDFVFADEIEGKIITSVNPETKEVIYRDRPKTETELLQEKIVTLQLSVAELGDIILSGQ